MQESHVLLPEAKQESILTIQQTFASTIQEICNFLNQKEKNGDVINAMEKLQDIQKKFLEMCDIYDISPEEFPKLPIALSKSAAILKRNFNAVQQYIAQWGREPNNLYDFIDAQYKATIEQYIKAVIAGLYKGFASKVLPSLPAVQAKEALTFSIINLRDFFTKILTNSLEVSDLPAGELFELLELKETVFKELEKTKTLLLSHSTAEGDLDPESTYMVLIAGLFSNLKNISLLSKTPIAITQTLIAQLSILQEQANSQNKRLMFENIESSLVESFPHSSLLPAYLTFSSIFNQCPDTQEVLKVTDKVRNILTKMYKLYGETSADFPGLPEIFSKDARALKERCQRFFFKDQRLIEKEMNIFYQQMVRRAFQMQICNVYNNTICLEDNLISEENTWQQALKSIISTLNETYNINDPNLLENWTILNQCLLLNETPVAPAIVAARRCIIALDELFKNSAEIKQLSPKVFEKIIESVKKLQALLKVLVENSLLESKPSQSERMQLFFEVPAFQQATSLTQQKNFGSSKALNSYLGTLSSLFTLPIFFSFDKKTKNRSDNLRIVAKSYGLTCQNVAGDGNCLFTAVALYLKFKDPQLYSTQSLNVLANELRKRMTNYISLPENRSKYKDFVTDQNLDNYLEDMKKSGTWGDHLSLHALANILNVTFVVINSDQTKPIVLRNPQTDKDAIICLGYEVPVHYQLLLPEANYPLSETVRNLIEESEFMDTYLEKSSQQTMPISLGSVGL